MRKTKNPGSGFTSLELTNFSVFSGASFGFVPGLNAFVGANSTGKTHLMKLLYLVLRNGRIGADDLTADFKEIFKTDQPGELTRHGANAFRIMGKWSDMEWTLEQDQPSSVALVVDTLLDSLSIPQPVFIPAQDMMSHTRRFLSTYESYKIDFSLVDRDIVAKFLSPESRAQDKSGALRKKLAGATGGAVVEKGERLFLRTQFGDVAMPVVAEGYRKLAALDLLLGNGLVKEGSVLFWDEPEANLNPSMYPLLAEALYTITSWGVQIFIATHEYLILKELEIQRRNRSLRYHCLDKTPSGVSVSTADTYLDIQPNLIEEEFLNVYDRSVEQDIRERAE